MSRENLTQMLREIAADFAFRCDDFMTCTEATTNCSCSGCEIILEAVKELEGGTGEDAD